MGIFSSLLSGKNLPSSVWDSGVLHLPEPLATAHKDLLVKNGWLADYQSDKHGSAGGQSAEDARDHVINRFLNSAARMQFVCAAPDDKQPEVRDMVFDQLGDGHIFLLDLAAGNGAGTLAILSLLCELRLQGNIPKLPLNVTILGIDFSVDALSYYIEIMEKIKPWLSTSGVSLFLNTKVCDMALTGNFNEVLECFFEEARAKNVNRFLCVISALSGAGKDGLERMHDSIKTAAVWLSSSQRSSSLLWVEPSTTTTRKPWFRIFMDTIHLKLSNIVYSFAKKADSYEIKTEGVLLPELQPRRFDWYEPHSSKITQSKVVVTEFRNEYNNVRS